MYPKGNWRDIPNHILKSNRTNRHSSAYRRLDEEHHSVTIDTGNSHSNYFHPKFNRIPSVRELQEFNLSKIILYFWVQRKSISSSRKCSASAFG